MSVRQFPTKWCDFQQNDLADVDNLPAADEYIGDQSWDFQFEDEVAPEVPPNHPDAIRFTSRSVGAETKKSAFYIGAIWQWVRFRQTDEFPPNHMYGGFYRGLGFRVSANNMGPRIVE